MSFKFEINAFLDEISGKLWENVGRSGENGLCQHKIKKNHN